MITQEKLFIGGEFVAPAGREQITVICPATEEVVGTVPAGTADDIDRAVAAARDAFDNGPWPRMDPEERRRIILAAGEILKPQADELSRLVVAQNGTPIRLQPGDMSSCFEYFGNLPLPDTIFREAAPGDAALVVREPRGVVGCIVPWNVPVILELGKTLPALLAGNTVVVKPSPETPLHDYAIAEAFAKAGLPPGVLNIVAAQREEAERLVRHPGVDMISFTGSTAAGRRIGAICGEHVKHVVLELGGKSAAIVLDDADLATAAPQMLHMGALLNNGEACAAWTRILVPRQRHDEIVDALVGVLSQVTVGDPLQTSTDVGPLVSSRQRDRVEGYIASGLDEGAKIVFGGGRPAGLDRGWYVEPTLFVGAHNAMRIAREEIFGPVALVIPYDDEDEAVRIANDSDYGLAGAVYTSDPQRGVAVAGRMRTGTVAVNCLGMAHAYPFGGYKDSGVGRCHGPEGFMEFFEIKTIGLPAGYQP
ncbi:aldehyde dehydrogenase [Mycobacterium branderi]|nr:aldehyde dehydrogenase [Mycobacterium branderi]MCV7231863.1 aldehyde dehydrogenase [Mycobacterium branderi]ORA40193.1 aldehyde dehydrogenase [Mycobacterium branderi]